MHNVWLIANREYLERVRTKAFIISTILIPLLMGGVHLRHATYMAQDKADLPHHRRLAPDQQLALDLQKELESRQRQPA